MWPSYPGSEVVIEKVKLIAVRSRSPKTSELVIFIVLLEFLRRRTAKNECSKTYKAGTGHVVIKLHLALDNDNGPERVQICHDIRSSENRFGSYSYINKPVFYCT